MSPSKGLILLALAFGLAAPSAAAQELGDHAKLVLGGVPFAVTVARNRCRDILRWQARHRDRQVPLEPLAAWIADPQRDALGDLLAAERLSLMADAVAALDGACRELLKAFYVQEESAEEIRRRIGLDTVQGVYYRRSVCLRRALDYLNSRLQVRSQ